MPVTFTDQVLAYLASSANQSTFISTIGLAAFSSASFAARYAQNSFQVDNVTLDNLDAFRLQQAIQDDLRIMGSSERRAATAERWLFDYRLHKEETLGWVDAAFKMRAQFNAHVVPGSFPLGPGAGVQQAGVVPAPPPMSFTQKFLLTLVTNAFTLTYTLQVYVFVASQVSPTDDLRRIVTLRTFLEKDPGFLVSLDGTPDQQPCTFVQIYPDDADLGGLLTQAGIVQLFNTADVLASFFTIPA
jgi:hypothetical protein